MIPNNTLINTNLRLGYVVGNRIVKEEVVYIVVPFGLWAGPILFTFGANSGAVSVV